MWDHQRCVACDGTELLKVPTTPGDHSHIVTGERLLSTVSIVTYVCTDCGHVEQWVNSKEQLKLLKGAWAEQVRARQQSNGDRSNRLQGGNTSTGTGTPA